MWQDEAEMQSDRRKAFIRLPFFLFCSVNLFTAIVLTIVTNPGYIPEDTEWDMPDGEPIEDLLPNHEHQTNLIDLKLEVE
jgi:hypothetical protein